MNRSGLRLSDFDSNAPLLELFKPQQVQGSAGTTQVEFTGLARKVPASLKLASDGATSIVVHLDQTEQLLGFRLKAAGCALEDVAVSIRRYREYNKFEEFQSVDGPLSGAEALLPLPMGDPCWAMGLKLTAEWKLPGHGTPGAELQLTIYVSRNAFSREVRRLDLGGVLKAASDCNADRQDDAFDTKHINSGLILERLPNVVDPRDVVAGNELYPSPAALEVNLIGEPINDGITMLVHLMNRNYNVQRNLPGWLEQRFDELILLDWSSKDPVADLPDVFADPRVRVVRVDGQVKFVRTIAQNLAIRVARYNRILKCDSDVELRGDFFSAHPLQPGEFWVGDWHHARENNERHLHGETFCFLQDLLSVGGYDERIKTYGQDDTNLKDRMVLAGLTKKVFDYSFMEHQSHDQVERAEGSDGIHPMVATYANRLMTRTNPLWSINSVATKYSVMALTDRLSTFQISEAPDEATTDIHIREAMRIIALWYVGKDELSKMTDAEINALIWERQVE